MASSFDFSPDAPWRRRFYAQQVIGSTVAPLAPERGVVLGNQSGVFQLYRWHVPSNQVEQLTDRPEGVLAHYLAPDGAFVYYLEDNHGDEIGHFVRLPYAGGPVQDVTPDLPPYSPTGFALSRGNRAFHFVAGDDDGFRHFFVPLDPGGEPGAPRLLGQHRALTFCGPLSYEAEIAVVSTTALSERPDFALFAYDTASGAKIGELWDGEGNSLRALQFSPVPGETRLLATTNRSGTEQLLLWEPLSGARRDLRLDAVTGAVRALDWSADGSRILLRSFSRGRQRLFIYDLDADDLVALAHLSGTVTEAYFSPAEDALYAHVQDAAHPTRLVALGPSSGAVERVLLDAGEAPDGRSWRSAEFPARDGVQLQGWLATPGGDGPFPTILDLVGGPGGFQADTYSPQSQAWLDHGFAWLSLNYRGCATFGREFETRIFGEPGKWELEDMAAARAWLVDAGISSPDAIFLHGWSYGGFLTLMGLGKQPTLWAGGLAGIAIADWRLQYEDSAAMLRGFLESFLGGTPEEVPAVYTASSPITYVDEVEAPVCIIQGRHDTRTPARPVERYVERLRARGADVEIHWFESGHGGSFADAALGSQHQETFMRFVQSVLRDR